MYFCFVGAIMMPSNFLRSRKRGKGRKKIKVGLLSGHHLHLPLHLSIPPSLLFSSFSFPFSFLSSGFAFFLMLPSPPPVLSLLAT